MVIRTLTARDLDAAHEAFLDAFSDYVVPLAPPRERFLEMLRRRGVVPEASVAVFDEGRMVAFTLNGIEGDRAYDSGTGVLLSHRRRGLGRQVMQAAIEVLQKRGCTSYILEVLEANTAARELYRGLGFRETRGLQCWTFDAPADEWRTGNPACPDDETDRHDCLSSTVPSWQNSDESIRRASDEHVQIGGLILFTATGDLAQMRGRITTQLLIEARNRAQKPLRIMNVDERDAALAAFLERAGAVRTVRQVEMVANFVLSSGDEAAPHAEQNPGGGGR
jgi:GNAT superfamily N-acetyltransferase